MNNSHSSVNKNNINDNAPQKKNDFTILIVDDSTINIQILGQILSKKSYGVSYAKTGQAALARTAEIDFDLILLDIMMPGMDGYEVCKLLKKGETTRAIPVIFITAKTDTASIVKGFKAGACDYISKPFKEKELLSRINVYFQLKKARKKIIDLERANTIMAMAVTANHELNQPLAVITGYLDMLKKMLKEKSLSAKEKSFINKIDENLDRINEILKKYSTHESAHFKEYLNGINMVVFDSKEDSNTERPIVNDESRSK